MSMAFVPLFFISSLYAQIGLGQSASEAGLYLLIYFGGFASAAQIGGRILDQRGARGSVVPGAIIAPLDSRSGRSCRTSTWATSGTGS